MFSSRFSPVEKFDSFSKLLLSICVKKSFWDVSANRRYTSSSWCKTWAVRCADGTANGCARRGDVLKCEDQQRGTPSSFFDHLKGSYVKRPGTRDFEVDIIADYFIAVYTANKQISYVLRIWGKGFKKKKKKDVWEDLKSFQNELDGWKTS